MNLWKDTRIILASSSPRRRELLENLGIPFTLHPADVDESFAEGLLPAQVVELLALRKAAAVAKHYDDGLIIGSDTVVVLDGVILGKPQDEEDAFRMLSALQGREHTVCSGLTVLNTETGEQQTGHVETKVRMGPVTPEMLWRYIKTGEPMDKAGSYAIQGMGSLFIEGIDGDYFSVVGLPVRLLSRFLEQFGVLLL